MNKMQEKLAMLARAQQSESRVHKLEEIIDGLRMELARVELDRECLAVVVTEGEGFREWLLCQDLSSAHFSKPSGKPMEKISVEKSTDVELAMAYVRHLANR